MKFTGDGEKRKASRIAVTALIIIAVFFAGIGIGRMSAADKPTVYCSMGASYRLYLNRDKTFSIYNLISSNLENFIELEASSRYRWDGDTLVLEFRDSKGTLYFQREGDALVFQKERSVYPEEPYWRLPDGLIFRKN